MNNHQIHQTSTHNPLMCGAVPQAFHTLHSKPNTMPTSALQLIWGDLPQTTINKAVKFQHHTQASRLVVDSFNFIQNY